MTSTGLGLVVRIFVATALDGANDVADFSEPTTSTDSQAAAADPFAKNRNLAASNLLRRFNSSMSLLAGRHF